MQNSGDTIGNRTHDLQACSTVPQPTAPPRTPATKLHLRLFEQAIGKEYEGMEVHLHSLLNLDSTSPFTPLSLFCCTYRLDHCMGPHSRFGFFGEGRIFYPPRPSKVLTCNLITWHFPVTTAATDKQQRVRFVLLSHISLSTIKIPIAAQQCCYGKSMSPATMKRT
jgi:hypothetical protein